jgi:hypothetical protein
MLFLVLVTSTKHYWVISAERRRVRNTDYVFAQGQRIDLRGKLL